MSEFAGDLPNRRRSKMDKITVNAFIHGGALSDPIELNPNHPLPPHAAVSLPDSTLTNYTSRQLPPINSLKIEFFGISSLLTPIK